MRCRHVAGAATTRIERLSVVPTVRLGWTPSIPVVAAPAAQCQRGLRPKTPLHLGAHRGQVTRPAARQSSAAFRPLLARLGLLGQALRRVTRAPARATARPLAGGPMHTYRVPVP